MMIDHLLNICLKMFTAWKPIEVYKTQLPKIFTHKIIIFVLLFYSLFNCLLSIIACLIILIMLIKGLRVLKIATVMCMTN